ncbi:MAG: hypothetical protein ACI4IQ_04685 [Eubacterium sp.]
MDNQIIAKLSKFAFVSSVIGVCTIGICPAFGIMGITVGLVFKIKNVELNDECKLKIKGAIILGIVSLAFFVIDIILAYKFLPIK